MDDLQPVAHINRTCLPENYSDFFFVDLHRRFPETFLVAEEDGGIIGYIMCRIERGLSTLSRVLVSGLMKKGHIVSVAVLPKHRRQGAGEALVVKAMQSMRLYNAKQCFLEVRVTNEPAVELYKKLGFSISRTIHRYYADGEDAYVMTKALD